jgi:hypothetical protein
MKPIEISVKGFAPQSPPDICAQFLDTTRWPEFTGYSILPGIAEAHFEEKTPEVIGSRIRVRNTDGSGHVEEIIAWDTERGFALRFQDFQPPLRNFATHFIETWQIHQVTGGTEITRSMAMYPKSLAGWLMLKPISSLMKKAFEKKRKS